MKRASRGPPSTHVSRFKQDVFTDMFPPPAEQAEGPTRAKGWCNWRLKTSAISYRLRVDVVLEPHQARATDARNLTPADFAGVSGTSEGQQLPSMDEESCLNAN